MSVDPADIRKLLGTVWFRSVFSQLSNPWRERLLSALVESVVVPNHVLRMGRREIRMRDVGLAELKELFSKSSVTEAVRGDVRLLMTVGNLWGAESLGRIQFECYFCFKPEANEMQLSELDVRSIGVLFDFQHGEGGPQSLALLSRGA